MAAERSNILDRDDFSLGNADATNAVPPPKPSDNPIVGPPINPPARVSEDSAAQPPDIPANKPEDNPSDELVVNPPDKPAAGATSDRAKKPAAKPEDTTDEKPNDKPSGQVVGQPNANRRGATANPPVKHDQDAVFAGNDDRPVDPSHLPAPERIPKLSLSDQDAARKYCRDAIIPKTGQTAHRDSKKFPGSAHAILTNFNKLWSFTGSQVNIKYQFLTGTSRQHDKIKKAMEEWTWYGNIAFQEVPAGGSGAHIRIGFDTSIDAGSWSFVGRDCSTAKETEQTMNLGWIDEAGEITAAERAVVLHEFGHVLGMLHEHQSPAGGGVPVETTDEALRYYEETQHWSAETVESQVINVYNKKDVSSFSQVDRLSIMQYPMPRQVTGLDHDIDYNYFLSELDKAYIGVMYPRPNETAHPKAPEWTFSYALAKTGIVREEPARSADIMVAHDKDVTSDSVDASRVRQCFSTWCQNSHMATARDSLRGAVPSIDPQHGLNPGDNCGDQGDQPNPVYVVDATPDGICSTEGIDTELGTRAERAAKAEPDGVARAVFDRNRVEDHLPMAANAKGKLLYSPKIVWTTADCPKYANLSSTDVTKATDYQIDLVTRCLAKWANATSVTFVYQEQSQPEPDIIFTFQRYAYDPPDTVIPKTSKLRSYCKHSTGMGSTDVDKQQPSVKHTICLRGASETYKESMKTAPVGVLDENEQTVKVPHSQWDQRSVMHEVGHWLGLKHENVGVYSYCIFTDPSLIKQPEILKKKADFVATVFDSCSIMDRLSRPQKLVAEFARLRSARTGEGDVRMRCRTVCDLSGYDKANILFLHPGRKVSGKTANKVIRANAQMLQLSDVVIEKLISLAKPGLSDWPAFRQTYIDALQEQMDLEFAASKLIEDISDTVRNAPAHGIAPPGDGRARAPTDNKAKSTPSDSLLKVMYNALIKAIGPTGSQILTLQSPTRYLSREEFRFNLQGVYSNFVKPAVIVEAEFRLTDALYDAAAVVSAPNGKSLSTIYLQVLNNFVPKYNDADRKVREERERIRSWLLTEVGDQDPYYKFDFNSAGGGAGDDPDVLRALNASLVKKNSYVRKMSRMEFSSQLAQDAYKAQMDWELQRDKIIRDAIRSKDPDKLDEATRTLAHTSLAQQNILAMHNANAVVRGYSHVVREALGHLDVVTPAEVLQDAKDAFRATANASLYGASKVYPVLMGPVDWSEGLDTGFAPEDLAENPQMLEMMIQTKAASLDNLKRQLTLLQSSGEGDPAILRSEVEKKAREVETLESNLHAKYLDSTIELAKIAIAIATDGASVAGEEAVKDVGALEAIKSATASKTEIDQQLATSAKGLDITGTAEDVKNQMAAVSKAQKELQGATSAWNSKKVSLARSEATSTKSDQLFLENQIATITADLSDLKARYSAALKARSQNVKLAIGVKDRGANKDQVSVGDLVANKPPAIGGGSCWQEVNVTSKQTYQSQSSSVSASASSERWNTDFWIGSAGGSTEASQGDSASANEGRELDVQISMKITNVTVDRSSWFKPELFDNASNYMKNNSGLKFCTYPAGHEGDTPQSLAQTFATNPVDISGSSILPAYPVAYILCKDVFIKVSNMTNSSSEEKHHLLEKSQASGGCFMFQYSRASETSSDSSAAKFEMASDGMIIRIPGPQILAYVQQIVPQDTSDEYNPEHSLGKSFYLPPPASQQLAKNPSGDGVGAQHGIRAPGQGTKEEATGEKSMPLFDVQRTSMTPADAGDGDKKDIAREKDKKEAKDVVIGRTEAGGNEPLVSTRADPAKPAKFVAQPLTNGVPAEDVKTNGEASAEEEDTRLLVRVLERLQSGDEAFEDLVKKALKAK